MSNPPKKRRTTDQTMEINVHAVSTLAAAHRDYIALSVLAGPGIGGFFTVEGDDATLGREADNSIAIRDPGISSLHARIFRHGSSYVLEDLGSKNGTYVNGEAITHPRLLVEGDRILLGQATVLGVRFQDRVELEAQKKLYESAVRDALTSLHNRRFFEERLSAEWAYATRHRSELALMMLDIDHFKRVNDQHGHPAGDAALRAVGHMLAAAVRAEDLVARFGGEEFVILARGLDEGRATQFAERIRRQTEHLEIPVDGLALKLTVSLGIAVFSERRPFADGSALVAAADAALYLAKQNGRNRVYLG